MKDITIFHFSWIAFAWTFAMGIFNTSTTIKRMNEWMKKKQQQQQLNNYKHIAWREFGFAALIFLHMNDWFDSMQF